MIFVIVAGVPVFRFTAGNPAELVLSSDTIQKVYYPETKPTILIFKTKKDTTELRPASWEWNHLVAATDSLRNSLSNFINSSAALRALIPAALLLCQYLHNNN